MRKQQGLSMKFSVCEIAQLLGFTPSVAVLANIIDRTFALAESPEWSGYAQMRAGRLPMLCTVAIQEWQVDNAIRSGLSAKYDAALETIERNLDNVDTRWVEAASWESRRETKGIARAIRAGKGRCVDARRQDQIRKERALARMAKYAFQKVGFDDPSLSETCEIRKAAQDLATAWAPRLVTRTASPLSRKQQENLREQIETLLSESLALANVAADGIPVPVHVVMSECGYQHASSVRHIEHDAAPMELAVAV